MKRAASKSLQVSHMSLIQHEALGRLRDALRSMEPADPCDRLLADATKHAAYLERCSTEAEAVLRGDLGAATRLWLLLREPIDAGPPIPPSVLDELLANMDGQAPRIMHGDTLLKLIAGVVRAANQPAEAQAMLDSLDRLLEPVLHAELAAGAAERAEQGNAVALKTFLIARSAPRWRAALNGLPDPMSPVAPEPADPNNPNDGTSSVFGRDRVPLDIDSWGDHRVEAEFPLWKVWLCMGEAPKWMAQIDRFGPRYTIVSISNPGACVGETVTIRGHGFGPTGLVYFPSPEASDPALAVGGGDVGVLAGVSAIRWSDTEIDVVVPPWATAGELHLNAYTPFRDPCLRVDVYRLGNTILFQGGLAAVFEVSIAGVKVNLESKARSNLTPGDAVAVSWRATVGPSVKIDIQLREDGIATPLWSKSGLPGGFAAIVLPVPNPAPERPRNATLTFTAQSNCGPAIRPLIVPVHLSVRPQLNLTYVEVTQGVQGDLGDVIASRAMPTVALKDTAVRVHMNCDRGGWYENRLDKITGSLTVDGRVLAPTNKRVSSPPDRGFVSVKGQSDPNRTNDTLNFTIPAAWLNPGAHMLTVRLVCNDPGGKVTAGQVIQWTWVSKAPMRVRGMWLYYRIIPANDFLLDYLRDVLDFLPTPLTDIGIANGPRPHEQDLWFEKGWENLLDDLEDSWDDADEDSSVRYLGAIAPGALSENPPLNPFGWNLAQNTRGIAGTPGIAALAMADRPDAGAHELGHTFGLQHINQPPGTQEGGFDTVDNGGILRRPPFDVRSSVAVPLPAVDLMGYPPTPVRAGITTWMRLFNMNF
jgi:hypothetical protein